MASKLPGCTTFATEVIEGQSELEFIAKRLLPHPNAHIAQPGAPPGVKEAIYNFAPHMEKDIVLYCRPKDAYDVLLFAWKDTGDRTKRVVLIYHTITPVVRVFFPNVWLPPWWFDGCGTLIGGCIVRGQNPPMMLVENVFAHGGRGGVDSCWRDVHTRFNSAHLADKRDAFVLRTPFIPPTEPSSLYAAVYLPPPPDMVWRCLWRMRPYEVYNLDETRA